MEQIVNVYNIPLGKHGYSSTAKIEVSKGAKIISAKPDRWSINLFVLEYVDERIMKEERELIVSNTGFKIPIRGEQGFLERVLEHVASIDIPNTDDQFHFFENVKR